MKRDLLPEADVLVHYEPVLRVPNSEFGFDVRDLKPLRNFLLQARSSLEQVFFHTPQAMPKVHVVLGNESADLDSIVSSILRAYELSLRDTEQAIYVPYINIHREELHLRNDALYLFENYGLSAEVLFFIDDKISLDRLYSLHSLSLHLVDHNELTPDQAHLASAVVDILDHHVDMQRYPSLEQKKIEPVGSCATLVASGLLSLFSPDGPAKALAGLLLAPILLDTSNLASDKKTTLQDRQTCQMLSQKASSDLPADYYHRLKAKRKEVASLTPELLLIRDFKKYRSGPIVYGISSLTTCNGFWLDNEPTMLPILEATRVKRGLDFLVLLMPPQEARKILVYSHKPGTLKALNESVSTQLTTIELSTNASYYTAQMPLSRKELQPTLHKICEQRPLMDALQLNS